MKVVLLSPKNLILHPKNPREISNHSFEGLMESIKKFGFQQPVVINEKNEILSGNQRTKAAIKLGIEKIPCIKVIFASEYEENAFLITMNNKGIMGDFTEGLRELMQEIETGLGADFIFDLNLDEVLKDLLPQPIESKEPIEGEGEEGEGEDDTHKEKTGVFIIFQTNEEAEELFIELRDRGYKVVLK